MERPVTLKNNLFTEHTMSRRYSDEFENPRISQKRKKNKEMGSLDDKYSGSIQTEVFSERDSHYLTNKLL